MTNQEIQSPELEYEWATDFDLANVDLVDVYEAEMIADSIESIERADESADATENAIDAAAATYFVDNENRNFGAAVKLD